jgi:acetyltransferase-like isoleucine patch superfamily enzyme
MKKVVERILRIAKRDPRFEIDSFWTNRALVGMFCAMALGIVRGLLRAQFFGAYKGFVLLRSRAKLKNTQFLTVGRNFIAEEGCEIDAISKQGIVFGDRVTVGAYALIRPSNAYGGRIGEGLTVGDNSNIGPYCYIGCSGYVEIGTNVMMGPRVSIFAENHIFNRTDLPMKEQGVTHEFVRIEDDCWIASHSVILAGVTVGRGSIVSAGSIVTKDVPPFSIVGGSPAKVIKSRSHDLPG